MKQEAYVLVAVCSGPRARTLAAWEVTYAMLHLWTQIVGKLRRAIRR